MAEHNEDFPPIELDEEGQKTEDIFKSILFVLEEAGKYHLEAEVLI